MTDDLRTILDDLTIGEPPPRLGVRALAAGNRRRRRGHLLAGVSALALAAAVAVPTLAIRAAGTVPVGRQAIPAPSYALLSYSPFVHDAAPSFAWDQEGHRYRPLPYYIQPSPDGTRALVEGANLMHPTWAVAGWSDALHGRNLHWQRLGGHQEVVWGSTSATLIKIDSGAHTNTYIDVTTRQERVVHWPAEATAHKWSIFVGMLHDDQTVFVTTDLRDGADMTEVVLDRLGRVTSTSTISKAPHTGLSVAATAVSADGRYVAVAGGAVLDFGGHRVIRLGDEHSPGFNSDFVGWYDDTHLIRTSRFRAGLPVRISIYDLTGHELTSKFLRTLPGVGDGPISAAVVPAGPGNEGAATISR